MVPFFSSFSQKIIQFLIFSPFKGILHSGRGMNHSVYLIPVSFNLTCPFRAGGYLSFYFPGTLPRAELNCHFVAFFVCILLIKGYPIVLSTALLSVNPFRFCRWVGLMYNMSELLICLNLYFFLVTHGSHRVPMSLFDILHRNRFILFFGLKARITSTRGNAPG